MYIHYRLAADILEGGYSMTSQVAVKAWGNSYGIRIPKKIMDSIQIWADDLLRLETDGDSIIIHKVFQHKTFEQRLAAYDGKISVELFDRGEPQGRELV